MGRRAWTPGLLSVVVPAYGVEAFLGEALDSLLGQQYGHIEILVVDDGSPDRSREIAEEFARRDKRVRVVRRPNGGLSAARNTGVAEAVGEFLTFVDGDDTVDPAAFAPAIDSLRSSGSDFAMTYYRRRIGKRLQPAGAWIRRIHEVARTAVDVESYPEAMANAIACSKIFRRDFYESAGLRFPEGVVYEDQPVTMRAFGRAHTFDVLPNVGIEWRIRDDQSSISQSHRQVENLTAHTKSMMASIRELREAGREHAAQVRAVQLLDNNMQWFQLNAVHRDPEYWRELRRATRFLLEAVQREEYLRDVGAYKKVLNELILGDRMEDAARFQETRYPDVGHYPTRRHGGEVYVDFGEGVEGIDEECFRLSRVETSPRAWVDEARWADGRLVLEGWAYLSNIDLSDGPPRIEVLAVGPAHEQVPLAVTQRPDARADRNSNLAYADITNAGFVAVLDPAALIGEGRWTLVASLDDGEREGEAGVAFAPWVEAAVRRPRVVGPGRVVAVRRNRAGRMFVDVESAATYATAVRLDGRHLELELGGVLPTGVHLTATGSQAAVLRGEITRKGARARFDLARLGALPAGAAERRLTLRAAARDRQGGVIDVADRDVAAGPARPGPVGEYEAGRDADGVVELVQRRCGLRIEGVAVSGAEREEALIVRGSWFDPTGSAVPVLRDRVHEIAGVRADDGSLVFPLTRTLWGHEGLLVPQGQYAIGMRVDDEFLAGQPSTELGSRLPAEELHARMLLEIEVFEPARPGVRVNVQPPLRPDERSERHQRLLRESSRRPTADRASVFFRALYGEVATGNALGVHEELRRRGSNLELCWSVADHGVPVPPGGVGLVELTREWHQAIAQSRYHMVDVHQLDWFTRPRGQDLIETMHGYPYKLMGHDWWARSGVPVQQVASFDRRAREWTYFVSPASYATPLLKKAFLDPAAATPRVLESGYPRNDVLLRPEAAEVRARTRKLLGLEDDHVAVLYAPTFRDYLSDDDNTAEMVTFFDPHEAVRSLPEEYVVLMRGHAFNLRAGAVSATRDRVIDVTEHPDVNDLILASDVAILDYSSLRFDYVLSGRPMIFLVPDLREYDAARGGVIPFEPTAPGPLVDTTAETVAWLRDLSRLTEEYADARATFRAEYVDLEDGEAGARLVDAVFVPRGDAPPR